MRISTMPSFGWLGKRDGEGARNPTQSGALDWKTLVRDNDLQGLDLTIRRYGPKGIDARFDDGTYPLHAAIRWGHAKMAAALLQAGANPALKDCQGLTAYDYAILSKSKDMLGAVLPEEAVAILSEALGQANTGFFQLQSGRDRARALAANLRALVSHRLAVPRDAIRGLHGILLRGDVDAIRLLGKPDFHKSNRTINGLTPLHCALLSKNERAVSMILDKVDGADLLAKDNKGLTPLHYACMLGLSDSVEAILFRCKKIPTFDIDAVHPRLAYSLAHLAAATGQPRVFAILCQHGAKINQLEAGCSPADLLCVQVADRDPLGVSTAQYILAAFNVMSLVTDQISPQASVALMLCSVLANATLSQKGGLRGQALYWGGEALSLAVRTGLAHVPLVKAAVDIYRVTSISCPCLNAVARSFQNIGYETGKAIRCAAVNSVILGSSAYRIRDSVRYAFHTLAQMADVITGASPDHLEEERNNLFKYEKYLEREWKRLNEVSENIQARHQELEVREVELKRGMEQLHLIEKKLLKTERILAAEQRWLDRTRSQLDGMEWVSKLKLLFGRSQIEWPAKERLERTITIGTTYVAGNKLRDGLSTLVNANQREYAERWGLIHRVVDKSLLENQCTVNGNTRDCSPYWNKVKVLKDWLDEAPGSNDGGDEWYIMADDDMVVTNMKIDPYKAIDQLRGAQDTSVIVAKDVIPYTGKWTTSVNTGLLLVRRDEMSRQLIDEIWERRNHPAPRPVSYCQTLGVCEKQHALHEQQALADIIDERPEIVNTVLSIVKPRDTNCAERGHIALNTFERSGAFVSKTPGWETGCFQYVHDASYPDGKWQPGDWMGQTAGVPTWGWYCEDKYAGKPPGPIRQDKIEKMLEQVRK